MRRLRATAIGLLLAVTLVAIAIAGVMLAEAAVHPARLPLRHLAMARAEAAQVGGVLQDVSITAGDGVQLRGWFAKPKSFNGSAVMLLHGVSDNREGAAGFAPMFLDAGYEVLSPDSRAHGVSGGRIATYGLLETDDIHRWVSWLEENQHPRCAYGFGESMGAALVVESLRTETRFCAVVAESGFAEFRRVAIDRIADKINWPVWLSRIFAAPAVQAGFIYARLRYGVDLRRANPVDAIAKTSTPVLLIHGVADRNIRPDESEELHAANVRGTELWLVPGANHCGAVNAHPQEFKARVLGWFAAHDRPVN